MSKKEKTAGANTTPLNTTLHTDEDHTTFSIAGMKKGSKEIIDFLNNKKKLKNK